MIRVGRSGATAATALPAALAGALLVAAPFAGTTTAPLAKSTPRAAVTGAQASSAHPAATGSSASGGFSIDISPSSIAMLAGAEMVLVGVGAGVIVMATRRRFAED
jgi:hypothetical protein